MASIDTFEAMLQRGQDNTLIRYSLGNEYLKLQQFDKAIEHLQKALGHDPNYSAAWKLLGRAFTDAERKDEAIKAYQQGIHAAEHKGDLQAAKEMAVFLKRLQK